MEQGRVDLSTVATKSWGASAAVNYSVKVTPLPFYFDGDNLPHFRCPPGTPRGGKWTDAMGSDCMLGGARVALNRIGERIGKLRRGEAPTRNPDLPSISQRARGAGYRLAQRVDNDPNNLPRGVRRLKDQEARLLGDIAKLEDAITADSDLEGKHRPTIIQLQGELSRVQAKIAEAEQRAANRSGEPVRRVLDTVRARRLANRIDNDPTNVYRKRPLKQRRAEFYARRTDELWANMFARARSDEERAKLQRQYEKLLDKDPGYRAWVEGRRAAADGENARNAPPTNPPNPTPGPGPKPNPPTPKPGPTPNPPGPKPGPAPVDPTPADPTVPPTPNPPTPPTPTPTPTPTPSPVPPTPSPTPSTRKRPKKEVNPWITKKLDGGRGGSTLVRRERVRREVGKLMDTQLELQQRIDTLRKRTRGDFASDADYDKHLQQIESVTRQLDQVQEAIDHGENRIQELSDQLKPVGKPKPKPKPKPPSGTRDWFDAGPTVTGPQRTEVMPEPTERAPLPRTLEMPDEAILVSEEPSRRPTSPTTRGMEASADVAARRSERVAQERHPDRVGGVFTNEQNARRRAAKVSREREGDFHLVQGKDKRFQIVPADAQVDEQQFTVVERYRRGKAIGAEFTRQPELFSRSADEDAGDRTLRGATPLTTDDVMQGMPDLPEMKDRYSEKAMRKLRQDLLDAFPDQDALDQMDFQELGGLGTEFDRQFRAPYGVAPLNQTAGEEAAWRELDATTKMLYERIEAAQTYAQSYRDYRNTFTGELSYSDLRELETIKQQALKEAEERRLPFSLPRLVDRYEADKRFHTLRGQLKALSDTIEQVRQRDDASTLETTLTPADRIPGVDGKAITYRGRRLQAGLVPDNEMPVDARLIGDEAAATKALREGAAIGEIPDGEVLAAMLDHDLINIDDIDIDDGPAETISWDELLTQDFSDGILADVIPQETIFENDRFTLESVKNIDMRTRAQGGVWTVFRVIDKKTDREYFLKASGYGHDDALLEQVGADMARLVGFDTDTEQGTIRLGGLTGDIRWSLQPHVADYQSDLVLQDRAGWREVAELGNGQELKNVNPEDLARIVVMDILTGNSDRHSGNIMIHPDTGHVAPIDHGLLFGGREFGRNDSPQRMVERATEKAFDGMVDPFRFRSFGNSIFHLRWNGTDEERARFVAEVERLIGVAEAVNWADFYSRELRERRGAELSPGEVAHLDALRAFTEIRVRVLRKHGGAGLVDVFRR